MAGITIEQYTNERYDYNGYCTNCEKVTRWGETEPDARKYTCPDCGKKSCYGWDELLMMGLVN